MKVKELVTMLRCLNQDLEVCYREGHLMAVKPGDAHSEDLTVLAVDLNEGSFEVHHGLLGMVIALTMATVHGEEDGDEVCTCDAG